MYQMISLLSSIFPHGFSSLSEKQNPDKIWPVTSLISSLTFCPLIYSVPTILVALLFRERHGTLPQRSFILAVSSIWNALSQISTRKLLFLSFFFFSFCVCVCVWGRKFISFRSLLRYHLLSKAFPDMLFQIITFPFLDTFHPVSLSDFFFIAYIFMWYSVYLLGYLFVYLYPSMKMETWYGQRYLSVLCSVQACWIVAYTSRFFQ